MNSVAKKALAVFACMALLLALPAFASADPGSPATGSAQAAAYGTAPTGPIVLGEEPPTPSNTANTPSAVAAERSVSSSSGVSSLPFTGFAVAGALALAVLMLGLGTGLRFASRERI